MEPTWVAVYRAHGRAPVAERALVLRALGIPHRMDHLGGQVVLLVPVESAERVLAELKDYDEEQARGRPTEELPPIPRGALPSAFVYAAVLVTFFLLERGRAFDLPWWQGGMVHGEAMGAGEWWRAATALTLHSDLAHLMGNILFGALYGVLFAQMVGSGTAWSATFLSGVLGNLANAWAMGPDHRSIGASTAVFGALGCLMAYEWRRRSVYRTRAVRRWAPLMAGLALFGFFGYDIDPESNTDIGAHVGGMFAGLLLGALVGVTLGLRKTVDPLSAPVQAALAGGTLLALVGAWALALG